MPVTDVSGLFKGISEEGSPLPRFESYGDNMMKRSKAAGGLVLMAAVFFAAGEARAGISIAMGMGAYVSPAADSAAARRGARLERLAEVADRLAAAGTGDADKAEVLLAGLYAGSVRGEGAPAVYLEARRPSAVRISAAATAVREKSAAEDLGVAASDAGAAGAPAVSEAKPAEEREPAEASAAGDSDKDEDKPTFGGMLLASVISMLIVAFVVLILL